MHHQRNRLGRVTQRQQQRIYTVYLPGSFVPLLRIETPLSEPIDSLATILQQSTGVDFPAVLCQQFDHIEQAVRQQNLTPTDIDWLTSINFTPERIAEILPAKPAPSMMLHVYHCDHLGTPLALVSTTGSIDWQITLDAIGQLHREYNPNGLYQPIRFQGQHYDADKFVGNKFEQRDSVGLKGEYQDDTSKVVFITTVIGITHRVRGGILRRIRSGYGVG